MFGKPPDNPKEGDKWVDELKSPFVYISGEWLPVDKLSSSKGIFLGQHSLVNCTGKWIPWKLPDKMVCTRCGNIRSISSIDEFK